MRWLLLVMLLAGCGAADDDDSTAETPSPVPCYDADGDGHLSCADDCDDSAPSVYPGAAEVCDGVDNDCDGYLEPTWGGWVDDDGDRYGAVGTEMLIVCDASLITGNADDCNDADADVRPYAPELCNCIDDDCDGVIDEASIDGQDSACYDGDVCIVGVPP